MQNAQQKILIIGATSAIARATIRLYAVRGACLHLVARNESLLGAVAVDARVRGAAQVSVSSLDVNDFERHGQAVDEAVKMLGTIDVALICHGSLPDQHASARSFPVARHEINTNGLSVISMLTLLAEVMSRQQGGTLAVITSVAGDRGRQSNYVYGAVKAMVSTYLQGLRGRLLPSGVHVVDIRPGFVDSPMTAHVEKKGMLWSSPERIGRIIVRSIDRRKHTVYAPFYWRFIMFGVKMLPEFLFKRLKF